jgi:hypothetical protein
VTVILLDVIVLKLKLNTPIEDATTADAISYAASHRTSDEEG